MNKVNGNQKLPAYNVQLSVDANTQLIVANETVQDSNDFDQLSRQYKNVEANIGADQDRCHTYDAGYHNLEQLEQIYSNQLNVFVASPRKENQQEPSDGQKNIFDRTAFIYDHEKDYYRCPAGEKLVYEKNYQKANKWFGRVYKSEACPGCRLKAQCLTQNNTSKYRRIRRERREIYAEWMYELGQSDQGKQMQKMRSTTVEPVFGNLKANLGFRRFRLKGHKQASAEFNLMCIAHNLNKLFRMRGNFSPTVQKSIDYFKTLCQRTIMRYLEQIYLHSIPQRMFRMN